MMEERNKEFTEIKEENPWHVSNIDEFLYYCCPECDLKCKDGDSFIDHATNSHEQAKVSLVPFNEYPSDSFNIADELPEPIEHFDEVLEDKEDIKPIVTEVTTSETIDTNVSNKPTSVSNNSATVSRNVSKDDDVTLETEKKGTVTLCYTSDDSSDSSDDEDTCNETPVMQPTKELPQNISQPKSAINNSSNLSNNKEENVPQSQNAFDYSTLSNSEVQIQLVQESSINVPTNLSNNNVQESMPKKRHKLWNQKPMNQTSSLMINETPERTEEVSKRAKKDYLKTCKVSSTSRSIVIHLDNSRIDENSSNSSKSTFPKSTRRPYSFIEDQKIVKWIAKTDNYSKVNGIAMWKLMEKCNVLKDRSYQSMKERFRKVIIGKIDTYDLREDELADFKIFNEYAKERHLKKLRTKNE